MADVKARTKGRKVTLRDGREFRAALTEDGGAVCYELPALDGATVTRIALTHEALAAMVVLSEDLRADGVMASHPPEDSYPDQTILHDERNVGNCLQATIAGVLGWPLAAVPHFALLGEGHWWDCAQAWLNSQGYWIDYQPTSYAKEGGELMPRCWLSGRSPRGFSHAVIGDSATLQMLHDPHPSRGGLVEHNYTIYFFRKPSGVRVPGEGQQ